MTNVRQLELTQWRRLAEKPGNRCLIPLTEFCEWTQDVHDVGGGKPIKGEMWFSITDHSRFLRSRASGRRPGRAMASRW